MNEGRILAPSSSSSSNSFVFVFVFLFVFHVHTHPKAGPERVVPGPKVGVDLPQE
ncbi:hypothetical protein ACRALDRAFT_2018834 [Sodiomyces alcalophilus JCM 7366]|uniref:uncharacterized protein n=1 Tax=Sodiomyces alcalophilus JCM 7366 TaxID=591952 RepID=UPI0039B5899B